MKKIFIVINIIILIILFFSCDRFDNTFKSKPEPPQDKTIEEFFAEFSYCLNNLNQSNFQSILDFYDDQYLNNGLDTLYIKTFYDSIFSLEDTIYIQSQLIDYCNESLKVKWQLVVNDSLNKEVIFDNVFNDYLKKIDTSYKFNGNQTVISFIDYITNFKEILSNGLIENNLSKIMNYFHDDYLNNGFDKNSMHVIYQVYASLVTTNLEILSYNIDEYNLKFNYWIIDDSSGINTSFIEFSKINPDSFLLVGDQMGTSEINEEKILVEVASGMYCLYCPYCDDALHQLKNQYGDQFYYVEYHWNDPLQLEDINILNYYGINSAPTAVFQGQTKIIGGSENTYEEFRNVLLPLFDTEPSAFLKDFIYEIDGDSLNGSMQIDIDDNVNLDNLYLKYVLVEEVSSYSNVFSGEPCRQVVIAKDRIFVGDSDLSQPVTFSLLLPVNLPDDIKLYIWLQTLEDPYNNETCKIYNVIEETIIIE